MRVVQYVFKSNWVDLDRVEINGEDDEAEEGEEHRIGKRKFLGLIGRYRWEEDDITENTIMFIN